jgi:hypothetical protein
LIANAITRVSVSIPVKTGTMRCGTTCFEVVNG